jgi:hypothetical protein
LRSNIPRSALCATLDTYNLLYTFVATFKYYKSALKLLTTFPISRGLRKLSSEQFQFIWPFERLFLTFSAIFCYCMITRQQIVEKMPINNARKSPPKKSEDNFLRPLEIGKVQLKIAAVLTFVLFKKIFFKLFKQRTGLIEANNICVSI